jgi:hypothetical protein
MAVTITKTTLDKLSHPDFSKLSATVPNFARNSEQAKATVKLDALSLDAISELQNVAEEEANRSLMRSVKVYLAAREGDFTHSIQKLENFDEVLKKYLAYKMIDGWIYIRARDGNLYPELVVDIRYVNDYQKETEYVVMSTVAVTPDLDKQGKLGRTAKSHTFHKQDVVRSRVIDILDAKGMLKETDELKADYETAMEYYVDAVMPGFARQYRFSGKPYVGRYNRDSVAIRGHRVINDLEPADYPAISSVYESCLWEDADAKKDGEHLVPFHNLVFVYDLHTHEKIWVNSTGLTVYVYNTKLGDKFVLPQTHRDLLNVLTSDLTSFTGDIVDGKTTGNFIMCTGVPGVGKTLTAEIYSEVMEKPLLSVHSGLLGTTPESVRKGLQDIFDKSARYGCILQLDEIDVFVMTRGRDVVQNAIVAEFLRCLERFPGLMFGTTNRVDEIDDAILSRCVAVIHYDPPSAESAKRIWEIISSELGKPLPEETINELVGVFDGITGRDIKMLSGVTFRMVEGQSKWNLDTESFRKSAMFRGVRMRERGTANKDDGVDPAVAALLRETQAIFEKEHGFKPDIEQCLKHLIKKAARAA